MIASRKAYERELDIEISRGQIDVLMVPSVRIVRNDAGLVVRCNLSAGSALTMEIVRRQAEEKA
jgi:hypothetical protein